MSNIYNDDYRTEFELRLIATALLSENADVREKIFECDNSIFTSSVAEDIFSKIKKIYDRYPEADYYGYVDALSKDEKILIIGVLQTHINGEIDEERIDDTLSSLRAIAAERELKENLSELLLSEDFSKESVTAVLEKSDSTGGKIENSLEKYFLQYNEPLEVIPTGFPQLDQKLSGGLIRGTLGTIGARPSTGKTTFAINIARHNRDKKVLFFSLEMSARMIYDRLLADIADLDYSETGRHTPPIETAKAFLSGFENLTVIDNVSDVLRMVEIINTENPDIVIIDYVQIITTGKDFKDTRQRIDFISQTLKRVAKRSNSCIITLSQVTRSGKEKPTMSDLKESGGLEQDSDYVILLHRPYVIDKSNKDVKPGQTTVRLDKNKFGDTGEIEYSFDGIHQRFTEEKSEPISHMRKEQNDGQVCESGSEDAEYTADDDLPF